MSEKNPKIGAIYGQDIRMHAPLKPISFVAAKLRGPGVARLGRVLRKHLGLSGLTAFIICAMLAFPWASFVSSYFSERSQALGDASHELETAAGGYAEYAAALADIKGNASLNIAGQSAAGRNSALNRTTIAEFRGAMNIPATIDMTVAFSSKISTAPHAGQDDGVQINIKQTHTALTARAVRLSSRVVVTASMSETDALTDWRHDMRVRGGELALVTLITGLLGVMLVIQLRHREKTQADLIAARNQADAGSRAKSDFLANMSHEIRTPMNGILGMTSLLHGTTLDEEQRRYVEVVQESGEALLTVVNDILDISKLEAGKLEIELIDFDLVATVESAAALMAPRAREKLIDMAVFVEPAARGAYRGDPGRLRQILLNLLNNAIKFTEKGGVSIEVIVKRGVTLAADGHIVPLRFEVADTGIGMPESVRQRLFQKFSQGDSSVTRRFGGTGLGLAICRELVQLMHGEIGVTSSAGAGSTFWFEIPFEKSAAGIIDRETLPEHFKTLRALIVDDIAMNIEVMGRQLKTFGMDVNGVDDGFAAMAELERAWHRGQPYDLVFLDQMMPGMSGSALAKRIRLTPHLTETKLIIVSSVGRAGITDAAGLRLDGVLEKPVRHQELLDTLINSYSTQTHRAATPIRPGSAPAKRAAIVPALRPLRILLAEDNKINQQFAIMLLKKAGHSVQVAENGHQAVDAVRASDFDVVLMDIQMPELDGVQATHQIRALKPPKSGIHIVAMTANAMTGAREQFLAEGMNDYISKPVQPALLLSMLADIAAKRPRRDAPVASAANGVDADVSPVLDLEKLAMLESELPRDSLNDLLSLYLRDAGLHLEEIARCRARKDFAGVARMAHTMVSIAGNLGIMQVSALARNLEIACRTGDTRLSNELVTELGSACELSSAALRDWMAARPRANSAVAVPA